ncbi:MAG: acetyl-CoA carboxylase biotin carboxyl carrier protein subunit [Anaerovorax sp.]
MDKITSPIAGKIQEINVTVGQTITDDDEAFVIEAMKMETVAYGVAGVVKEILVKVGDRVDEEDPLASVE